MADIALQKRHGGIETSWISVNCRGSESVTSRSLAWHDDAAHRVHIYCKRAILFFSSSKILTPHPPLRPASLSSPRNKGGEYTLAGRRRGWGSIFWKTREIGLSSYSKICTLWCSPTEPQRSQALCMTVRRQHQKNFVILSGAADTVLYCIVDEI